MAKDGKRIPKESSWRVTDAGLGGNVAIVFKLRANLL
jgi:hypothetical protein